MLAWCLFHPDAYTLRSVLLVLLAASSFPFCTTINRILVTCICAVRLALTPRPARCSPYYYYLSALCCVALSFGISINESYEYDGTRI